jgi:hypothetical protein
MIGDDPVYYAPSFFLALTESEFKNAIRELSEEGEKANGSDESRGQATD